MMDMGAIWLRAALAATALVKGEIAGPSDMLHKRRQECACSKPSTTGEIRMRKSLLWAPSLALLAACSGGGSDQIQPGMWETTTRMTEIEVPGMPPEIAQQMKAQMQNQSQTQSQCITPEQAANPAGNVLNQGSDAQGCNFSDSTFAGGRINVRGTCPGPGGQGSATMSWEGSYTATTMEGRIRAEVQAPAGAAATGPQTIRMSGTLSARRTGECPAS
jgi:hypothetical protein